MPRPSSSDVHVSQPLTQLVVAHFQQTETCFDKVFPFVGSSKKNDSYYLFTQADLSRIVAQKRAPGARPVRADLGLETATFDCDLFALEVVVEDDVVDNADEALDLAKSKSMFAEQNITLALEERWAADYMAASVWTSTGAELDGSAAGFTPWDDGGSDPVSDILNMLDTVEANSSGHRPNVGACSRPVMTTLLKHPAVIDRLKYTSGGPTGIDILAKLVGLERICVSGAVKNTAAQGATASYSRIVGNHFLVAHTPKSAGKDIPSAGYSFVWNRRGAVNGLRVMKKRDDLGDADVYQVERAIDFKVVSAPCGGIFLNCHG